MSFIKNVEIYIDEPNSLDDFLINLKSLCEETLKEDGCLSFDFAQNRDDMRHFFLWEVFIDLDAFKAHHEQTHTKEFIENNSFRKINSWNLHK